MPPGDLVIAERNRTEFRLAAGAGLAGCVSFPAYDHCEHDQVIQRERCRCGVSIQWKLVES